MADSRDWDKEMAEIDRLMAKEAKSAPGTPSPTTSPASAAPVARRDPGQVEPKAAAAPLSRRSALGLWSMALLGSLGAGALVVWPYAKGCGTMLAVYLVGVAAVGGAGIWTMRSAWLARRGIPHLLGLVILLAALGLATLEILPRIGYAATALTWGCTT